jgi:hypothetical protein
MVVATGVVVVATAAEAVPVAVAAAEKLADSGSRTCTWPNRLQLGEWALPTASAPRLGV